MACARVKISEGIVCCDAPSDLKPSGIMQQGLICCQPVAQKIPSSQLPTAIAGDDGSRHS